MDSIIPKIDSKEIYPLLKNIMSKIGELKNDSTTMKNFGIESVKFDAAFFNSTLTVETLTDIYSIQSNSFGLKFSIKSSKKPAKPSIFSSLNVEDYIYQLTDDVAVDQKNLCTLIKEVGEYPANSFNHSDNTFTQLFIEHDEITAFNPDICHWFVKYLGLQLGAISMSEYRKIKNELPFENNAIVNEKSSLLITHSFEKVFKVLKEFNYTPDNTFGYNDCDNEAFFIERGDIQAIVHSSQNCMFVTAKNMKTNIVKIWLSMYVYNDDNYPLVERIINNQEYDEENELDESKLNIIQYVASIANSYYGYKYDYPVELNGDGFLKSYDFYIDNFDYDGQHCLYNSDKGFNPYNVGLGANAEFDIKSVYVNLYEEHDISLEPINNSSIPVNSLEYFFRSCLFEQNRATALHYLFMGFGTGFYWDGEGFCKSGLIKEDLPAKPLSLSYSPLDKDTRIYWQHFVDKVPDDIKGEWRQALFEFIFYIKELGENSVNNESYLNHKDNIIAYYNNYYDQEVIDRITESRKKGKNI